MSDEDLAYFRPSYAHDYDEPSTYKGDDPELKPYVVSRRLYGLRNISVFMENKENHEVSYAAITFLIYSAPYKSQNVGNTFFDRCFDN
jgi:hypothetical protein